MGNYILVCQRKQTPAVKEIPSTRWLLEPWPVLDPGLPQKFHLVRFFTSEGIGCGLTFVTRVAFGNYGALVIVFHSFIQ